MNFIGLVRGVDVPVFLRSLSSSISMSPFSSFSLISFIVNYFRSTMKLYLT